MKLKTFLHDKGYSINEFAELCDLSRFTIYNITKEKPVMLEVAHIVHKASRGQVGYEDMLSSKPFTKGRHKAKNLDPIKEKV